MSSLENGSWPNSYVTNGHRIHRPQWRTSLFLISLACLLISSIPIRLIPTTSQTLNAQDHPQEFAATTLYERVQSMSLVTDSENATPITIEGRVRNADYTAAQAIVFCLQVQDSIAQLIGRSVTDDQGRYSLTIAASPTLRKKPLTVYAVDAKNRLGWDSKLNISNLKSEKLINIPLLLNESSGSINGELLAPGDKPMSGIRIMTRFISSPDLRDLCRLDIAPFEFDAVSSEDGHFIISELPRNMIVGVSLDSDEWDCLRTVTIGTSGDVPDVEQELPSTLQFFERDASIKLFPKVRLHGVVVDRKGTPIADVRIRSFTETKTDESGTFSIQHLDANAWGTNELKSYREPFEVEPPIDSRFVKTYFTLDHEQLSTRQIRPVVLEGALVSGCVLSAETKQPLEGIHVQSESAESVLSSSDAEGNFRFALKPGQRLIRLAPHWITGQERKQFQEDPKYRAVRPIDVLDNEPVDLGVILLDIETKATEPLKIRATLSDGKPAESCLVVLSQRRSFSNGSVRETGPVGLVRGNSVEQYVLTDHEGIATVKPAMGWVAPESIESASRSRSTQSATNVLVIAFPSKSPKYFARLEMTNEIPSAVVDLKLTEGAHYSGRVLHNGTPLAGVTVRLDARRAVDSRASFLPAELLQAETNEQGVYALFVPAWSSYIIQGLQNFPRRGWITHPFHPLPLATKSPTQFVFADIELVSGSRSISGIVVDDEGNPIQGATIAYRRGSEILASQSNRTTNDDGKFLFNNLPEGSLSLVARTRENGQSEVQVLDQQSLVRIVISR